MNFDMPELGWRYGYPLIILIAVAVVLLLVRYFRRKKWLKTYRSFQKTASSGEPFPHTFL